jgi:hypothetical protein
VADPDFGLPPGASAHLARPSQVFQLNGDVLYSMVFRSLTRELEFRYADYKLHRT